MTITYSLDVATARFMAFTKMLFRWKGSIYKLVLWELGVFAALYYLILVVYRFALSATQKEAFSHLCYYFRDWLNVVPITFVLGFYVSIIVTRWWNIYDNMPWPDRTCVVINAHVRGSDERGRLIRRNLVRYLHIMAVLCLRCVSTRSRKRFPTLDHMVESKVMTEDEKKLLESVSATYGNYFQPAIWFGTLAAQAREEGRIRSDEALKQLIDELGRYRMWMGNLMSYDWISVPLVYTQVVSIAIYTFFFACLFGRQYLHEHDEKYWVSEYFPLFTFIQFFFYMGWLKVAEVLINPLGEDDDDFEVNYLVDRNVAVGFIMVDELFGRLPPLVRDPYWGDTEPTVPYTTAAVNSYVEPFLGSASGVQVPQSTQKWASEDNVDERKQSRFSVRKLSRYSDPQTSSTNLADRAAEAVRKFSRGISDTISGRRPSRVLVRGTRKGRKYSVAQSSLPESIEEESEKTLVPLRDGQEGTGEEKTLEQSEIQDLVVSNETDKNLEKE